MKAYERGKGGRGQGDEETNSSDYPLHWVQILSELNDVFCFTHLNTVTGSGVHTTQNGIAVALAINNMGRHCMHSRRTAER